MKGFFALFMAVIYTGFCAAQPLRKPAVVEPVSITNIKIYQDKFSHKKMVADFNYDGSLGDMLWFGVLPFTDDLVNGVGYAPAAIETGKEPAQFSVARPQLIDKKSTTSHTLEFSFYHSDQPGSLRMEIPFKVEWKSLEDFFGLQYVKPAQEYLSVLTVVVDESSPEAAAVLKALAASGVVTDKMEVIDTESLTAKAAVAIRFSEGVSALDFTRILAAVKKAGSTVFSLGFDTADNNNFELGKIFIASTTAIQGQVALNDATRLQLENVKDMTTAYGIVGQKLTPGETFLAKAVERARLLNMDCAERACKQAYDLASAVLQQEPDNAKAPIQMAFAALQMHDIGDAITEGMDLIDKALKKHPDDGDLLSWKGFLLYLDDSQQEAETYFIKAKDRPKQLPAFYLRQHAKNLAALGKIAEADKLYKELMAGNYNHADDVRGQYGGLKEYLDLLKQTDNPYAEIVYEKLLSDFPDRNSACEKPGYAQYLLTKHADTQKVRKVMSDPGISCERAAPIRRLLLISDWSESNAGDKATITRLLKDLGDVASGISEISQLAMGEKVVGQIAAAGIDLNQKGESGMSALHLVTADGNVRAAELLLKSKANVDAASIEGATPLIIAVAQQDPAMVQLLLRYKANPTIKGKDGRSALDIANLVGDKKLIALLKANQPAI